MFLHLCLLLFATVHCEVYFEESFTDDASLDKWHISKHKESEQGKVEISAGTSGISTKKGMMTKDDARFYWMSQDIKPFTNRGKTMVVQYSVRFDKHVTCGGSYIKLLRSNYSYDELNGETPYNLMFGPDICGMSTKRVHVILNYKGRNVLVKKDIPCETDTLTHHYALILTPDNRYKVRVDCTDKQEGELEADFDLLPPKQINDPSLSKPADWVDEAMIDDETDTKPADYPVEKIVDSAATKPEDWDDESDGDWEAPMITNPEWKGEWKAKQISNPAYKGPWVHPKIDNPEYKTDDELYVLEDNERIAFDVWQVDSGSIISDLLVTDDVDYANKMSQSVCDRFEDEKAKKKELDEKKKDEDEKTKPDDAEPEEDEGEDIPMPDDDDESRDEL